MYYIDFTVKKFHLGCSATFDRDEYECDPTRGLNIKKILNIHVPDGLIFSGHY